MTTKLVSTALLILSVAAGPALAKNQTDGQARTHTTIKLIKKLRTDNSRLPIEQLLGKHVTHSSQPTKNLKAPARQSQTMWLSENAR
ncbi:hypothetical protein [Alteromonas gilva]|uniref:Uncharacterized protein n=1 Tax=Alteromonas gilva TaxID=2987522 RepID=A0ABT5L4E8_9ALTE|nr:hypothetical protein [Alteromonas gilva]MDC8830737.1 hypothetical protein [Alteromonas gilva]